MTLHLNGDTLHVIHVRNAHTDGDALVRWAKADVLHMGDTFFNKTSFPFVDLDSGGSIDGVIAAIRQGIGIAGANTRIIPGHGKVATKAEMEVYLAMLDRYPGEGERCHPGRADARAGDRRQTAGGLYDARQCVHQGR